MSKVEEAIAKREANLRGRKAKATAAVKAEAKAAAKAAKDTKPEPPAQ